MINLTEVAASKVKEIMTQQDPAPAALRVAVVGGGCSGFSYHMAFETQVNGTDNVYEFNGLKVLVDQMSEMYLEGVEVDYVESLEGAGLNAVYPAGRGWRVTGLDSSRVALEKAAAMARDHQVSTHWAGDLAREFSPRLPGLLLLEADLELWSLPAAQFDLIVCFNFLQRSLFASIERALRHGGMLVYETFTVAQLGFPDGPHNPDYLLRAGELQQSFGELETFFYCELRAGKGIASLLARKP